MRLIIAGSRHIVDPFDLNDALSFFNLTATRVSAVLCGECRGADKLGSLWAKENDIPVESFPADWGRYPQQAGHLRNAAMAADAEALLVLWDGVSRGTKSMIRCAVKENLPVMLWIVPS